jgi:hypothetical protein
VEVCSFTESFKTGTYPEKLKEYTYLTALLKIFCYVERILNENLGVQ